MRERAELISLFGRAEVARASAYYGDIQLWAKGKPDRRIEAIKAMGELRAAIASPPHEAVAMAQSLDPDLRAYIISQLL